MNKGIALIWALIGLVTVPSFIFIYRNAEFGRIGRHDSDPIGTLIIFSGLLILALKSLTNIKKLFKSEYEWSIDKHKILSSIKYLFIIQLLSYYSSLLEIRFIRIGQIY